MIAIITTIPRIDQPGMVCEVELIDVIQAIKVGYYGGDG